MHTILNRPLPWIAIAYAAGIALQTTIPPAHVPWWTAAAVCAGVVAGGRGRGLWGAWTAAAAFGVGVLTVAASPPATGIGPERMASTTPSAIIATLSAAPRLTEQGWRAEAVACLAESQRPIGRVQLRGLGALPGVGAGDVIAARAQLFEWRAAGNPGDRYRGAPQVMARVADGSPMVTLAGTEPTPSTKSWRRRIAQGIRRHTSTVGGALVLALGLGEAGAMPADLRALFRTTGTSHLLAISGLHLALVALFIFGAVRWTVSLLPGLQVRGHGVQLAAAATLFGVLGYGSITGWQIATVRAAWMVGTVCVGVMLRLRTDGWSCLSVAVLASLAQEPARIHAAGFQLSVTAVAALVLSAHAIGSYRDRAPSLRSIHRPETHPVWRFLRATAWSSTVAWMATAPLIAFYFGCTSFGAPLVNLVIVPLVGFALLPFALLSTAAVALTPALAPAALSVTDALCRLVVSTLEVLQPICGYTQLGPVSGGTCGWLLGAVFCCLLVPMRAKRSLLGLSICLAAAWACSRPPAEVNPGLQVTFLNVGHGDCIVARPSADLAILVDGGGQRPKSKRQTGRRVVVPALRALGIERLHAVVLTHADADHLNGLLEVAKALPIEQLWWNGRVAQSAKELALLAHMAMQGTRLVRVDAMTPPVELEGTTVEFLGPPPARAAEKHADTSRNDGSVVLRLTRGEVSFLLTGDIEGAAERALIESGRLGPVTVLKVPHHGSMTSSSVHFVETSSPAHAVISCGSRGQYNLPANAVIARYQAIGSRIHRTDRDGAVHFSTDGTTLRVKHGRQRTPTDHNANAP